MIVNTIIGLVLINLIVYAIGGTAAAFTQITLNKKVAKWMYSAVFLMLLMVAAFMLLISNHIGSSFLRTFSI